MHTHTHRHTDIMSFGLFLCFALLSALVITLHIGLILRSGFHNSYVLVFKFLSICFNFQVVQPFLKLGLCGTCFVSSSLSFC